MTRVYSIFERIGQGGGGKVKAVYHRMNALAEMHEFDPVLLCLDHGMHHRLNFAELQAAGTIARRVRLMSVPEACLDAAIGAGIRPFDRFPAFDTVEEKGKATIYLLNGEPVMTDRVKDTPLGVLTKRIVGHPEGELEFTLHDGLPWQLVHKLEDGVTEITDFVRGLPIRWMKARGREFIIGKNLIDGKIYRMPRAFGCAFFELIPWQDALVFFDGVTSAYLSSVTKARRALFLHADHRAPDGQIVPRSRFLIENFKGEAIITSTHVHKRQMEADVTPAADVHVIPHFCETSGKPAEQRQHLVTVSRLELVGKPIHECIDAFCSIMDEFPAVDYLIYGLGSGQAQLEDQIAALNCGHRVRLMGYTNRPLDVFQQALASVYPTLTEGFGLSILEALSNGCPVISYDVNYGPREMIEPGTKGELVKPGDIAGLATAMRRVLSNPVRYQQATGNGLDRYTRKAYLANYRHFVQTLRAAESNA